MNLDDKAVAFLLALADLIAYQKFPWCNRHTEDAARAILAEAARESQINWQRENMEASGLSQPVPRGVETALKEAAEDGRCEPEWALETLRLYREERAVWESWKGCDKAAGWVAFEHQTKRAHKAETALVAARERELERQDRDEKREADREHLIAQASELREENKALRSEIRGLQNLLAGAKKDINRISTERDALREEKAHQRELYFEVLTERDALKARIEKAVALLNGYEGHLYRDLFDQALRILRGKP